MDSPAIRPRIEGDTEEKGCNETYVSLVDPFLVEALQHPRHRLTILRMEFDVQKFLQKVEQQSFEFQQFPTSYLRLAAHRVAQHYGLQTTVHDNSPDGSGNRIVAWKTLETRYPAICLSEVLTKQSECDKPEQKKIVLRPSANKGLMFKPKDSTGTQGPIRTVEQRKEEYDRARARIFSGTSGSNLNGSSHSVQASERKNLCVDDEVIRSLSSDMQQYAALSDSAMPSRVAILRDIQKDRSDPDYDRNYDRYSRSLSNGWGVRGPCDARNMQFPLVLYDTAFSQLGQLPIFRASNSSASSQLGSPFPAIMPFALAGDRMYSQWPSPSMMYAHSYEQFRHTLFPVPASQQQPLTFGYSQNN